jgi:hypothetical protein
MTVAQLPNELLANQLAVAELADSTMTEAPGLGWTVGQVCAHLILTNGLFVETARAFARGEHPDYDNEPTVDDTATAALAAGAGSLSTIAAWLRTSARDYDAFVRSLPPTVLDATVTTTIRHEGSPIVDREQRRLGDLIVGQLTFHAGMHLDQVRALVTPS